MLIKPLQCTVGMVLIIITLCRTAEPGYCVGMSRRFTRYLDEPDLPGGPGDEIRSPMPTSPIRLSRRNGIGFHGRGRSSPGLQPLVDDCPRCRRAERLGWLGSRLTHAQHKPTIRMASRLGG